MKIRGLLLFAVLICMMSCGLKAQTEEIVVTEEDEVPAILEGRPNIVFSA